MDQSKWIALHLQESPDLVRQRSGVQTKQVPELSIRGGRGAGSYLLLCPQTPHVAGSKSDIDYDIEHEQSEARSSNVNCPVKSPFDQGSPRSPLRYRMQNVQSTAYHAWCVKLLWLF